MALRLQGYNLYNLYIIFKYVKSEHNVCDYSSRHSYKDLAKVKELTSYVNFLSDDATPNALTIAIIKKTTKKKLARRNHCCKFNKLLTFLNYTKNRNTFKHFLKSNPKLKES